MTIRYLVPSTCQRMDGWETQLTYPMLDPNALPPFPAMRMKIQAIMFKTSVADKRSHNWYRRVIRGRDASGISSAMEWKMRG